MARGIAFGLTLATFAALSACSSPTSFTGLNDSWELLAFELKDGSTIAVSNPERYTLTFQGDGRVGLGADCNRCSGQNWMDGEGSLSFSAMACTRAYCGPESLFDEYVSAVQTATSYERRGTELRITYAGGNLRFRQK